MHWARRLEGPAGSTSLAQVLSFPGRAPRTPAQDRARKTEPQSSRGCFLAVRTPLPCLMDMGSLQGTPPPVRLQPPAPSAALVDSLRSGRPEEGPKLPSLPSSFRHAHSGAVWWPHPAVLEGTCDAGIKPWAPACKACAPVHGASPHPSGWPSRGLAAAPGPDHWPDQKVSLNSTDKSGALGDTGKASRGQREATGTSDFREGGD